MATPAEVRVSVDGDQDQVRVEVRNVAGNPIPGEHVRLVADSRTWQAAKRTIRDGADKGVAIFRDVEPDGYDVIAGVGSEAVHGRVEEDAF